MGHIHGAFKRSQWADAEKRCRELVARYPDTEAAPEALCWAGVSRYKGTQDGGALGETAKAFQQRYQGSAWAKKASVRG